MSASPAWLEGLARGAARRQLDRRAAGAEGRWGAGRLSRRQAVGGATAAAVGLTVLKHVPAASAEAPCAPACRQAAGRELDSSNKFANKLYGSEVDRLLGQIGRLESKLGRTKGAKARSKIQSQIHGLERKAQTVVGAWQLAQIANQDAFFEDLDQCKQDSQCGSPARYPSGQPPPAPGNTGTGTEVCADPRAGCGNLCCTSGSRCCSACTTCCIVEVSCGDCCPK